MMLPVTEEFSSFKSGAMAAANALIDKLGDRLLMGHVLYQRYMHPTEISPRYVEQEVDGPYADHPGARGVYRLALRRKPGNWRAPQQPLGVSFGPLPPELDANVRAEKLSKTRYGTRKQRRHARYVTRQIKSLVRRGRPTQALKRLQRKDIRRGYMRCITTRHLRLSHAATTTRRKMKRRLNWASSHRAIRRKGGDGALVVGPRCMEIR